MVANMDDVRGPVMVNEFEAEDMGKVHPSEFDTDVAISKRSGLPKYIMPIMGSAVALALALGGGTLGAAVAALVKHDKLKKRVDKIENPEGKAAEKKPEAKQADKQAVQSQKNGSAQPAANQAKSAAQSAGGSAPQPGAQVVTPAGNRAAQTADNRAKSAGGSAPQQGAQPPQSADNRGSRQQRESKQEPRSTDKQTTGPQEEPTEPVTERVTQGGGADAVDGQDKSLEDETMVEGGDGQAQADETVLSPHERVRKHARGVEIRPALRLPALQSAHGTQQPTTDASAQPKTEDAEFDVHIADDTGVDASRGASTQIADDQPHPGLNQQTTDDTQTSDTAPGAGASSAESSTDRSKLDALREQMSDLARGGAQPAQ